MNALKEQQDMKAHSMRERAHSCEHNLGGTLLKEKRLELEWSPNYGWKARHMDENETHLHSEDMDEISHFTSMKMMN
jgi:hypothetical protein